MKRLNVVVVLGMLAVLLTDTGTALAASAVNPIQALRRQFVAGRGVLVSETSRTTIKGSKQTYIRRTTGTVGFGKSGVVGYDLTSKMKIIPGLKATLTDEEAEAMRTPIRAVNMGRYTYVQGVRVHGLNWGPMPEGTTWIRFGKNNTHWGSYGQRGDQLVDTLNPARLKSVISKSASFRSGEYRGTLKTPQDLYAGLGPMNPDKYKISFRLFISKEGLPVRLITQYEAMVYVLDPDGNLARKPSTQVVDTRYHHWNAKVKIVAPPASEVVDFDDVPINQPDQGGAAQVLR
ncbi:hypothetical protein [Microtetraspora malaysiensis]|uniref:hypothetical protein n=1 Tax=Microtetraspora malaysiensis TaxID=161358 RepID=UPI0008297A16|nr:hypothetical protein [Microtetraspora malaysiensis]